MEGFADPIYVQVKLILLNMCFLGKYGTKQSKRFRTRAAESKTAD